MKIWILTSEYNEYDQYGEYFIEAFIIKPQSKDISKLIGVSKDVADHILNGGGRVDTEHVWYNLREREIR